MTRAILVAAALASVSFSPRHAEASEAPWCAVISTSKESVYWDCQYRSSRSVVRKETSWPAIVASVIRAHTTSPRQRSTGSPGNVALARREVGLGVGTVQSVD
jgi:hypothetical protein